MKNLFLVLVLMMGIGVLSFAQTTHEPEDCEAATINALMVSAGDTIILPVDECTLAEDYNHDSVHWRGYGVENTIINIDGFNGGAFHHPASMGNFRVNLIDGDEHVNTAYDGFEIGWMIFDNQAGGLKTCIDVINASAVNLVATGVIHNTQLINCRILVYPEQGVPGIANSIWAEESRITMTDPEDRIEGVVYVESSTCTRPDTLFPSNCVDANTGGRYVFRFNTITDTPLEAHGIQGPDSRATRSWEIYGNVFESSGGLSGGVLPHAMFLRAGTGMIFDNTFTGTITNKIFFDNLRSKSDSGFGVDPNPCDGDDERDENIHVDGWPCLDQIGRGEDDEGGTFPDIDPQADEPAFAWDNGGEVPGVDCSSTVKSGGSCTDIVEDRDYVDDSKISVDTRANRPSMGETEKQAHWSTDQGGNWKLKNFDGSDNVDANDGCLDVYLNSAWVDCYYTPATFPHINITIEEWTTASSERGKGRGRNRGRSR